MNAPGNTKKMKGISPLISAVIVMAVTVATMGIVFTTIVPTIQRAQEAAVVNEATQNMRLFDDLVRQTASEATGSLRSTNVKVNDGSYVVRNGTGLEFIFDANYNPIPSRAVISDGAVKISTGMSALGLVGYWRFDEGGGNFVNDSSGYGRDGNITNATAVTWTSGKYGNGLNFDGTDNAWVNFTPAVVNGLTDFTLAFWIRTSISNTLIHGTNTGNNELRIRTSSGDDTVYIKGSIWSSRINLRDGNLKHVVVTRDGNSGLVELYTDGLLRNSSVLPTGALTINCFGFGQDQDTICGGFDSNESYNGLLDEAHIYKRILNQSEIVDDFNMPPSKLKISLDYDNIILTGLTRFGKGASKICFEKTGIQGTKAVVNIRVC